MSKPKLVRPLKAIVVGDVDVICKQIGKYFDEYIQVGREKKFKRRELDGAQIVCFATQACGAGLKQEWTTFAKDHDLPMISCRRGSAVTEILNADFEIEEEKEEAPAVVEPPVSLIKAVAAEEVAKQMVDEAQAAAPASKIGIESLDFLANIQAQVQEKLSTAQAQTDEAAELYLKEADKVQGLENRIKELEDALKTNEDRIAEGVAAKLQKAVDKESVKLHTELRRKDKAISDAEKKAAKLQESLDSKDLQLLDAKAKLEQALDTTEMIEMDFDIDKVVMTHHLLMLAHSVVYVDKTNKWLMAVWKILQGISEDPEISTVINRFHDAAEAKRRDGKTVLIPPMTKEARDKIKTALHVM